MSKCPPKICSSELKKKCSKSLCYQHLQKRQEGISKKKNTNLQVYLWLLIRYMALAPLPIINTFPEHYWYRVFVEHNIENIFSIFEGGVTFLSYDFCSWRSVKFQKKAQDYPSSRVDSDRDVNSNTMPAACLQSHWALTCPGAEQCKRTAAKAHLNGHA